MQIQTLESFDALTLNQLSAVLTDCVQGGASVSFMLPFEQQDALVFWQKIAADAARGARAVLVARQDGVIVGTVHLVLEQPPNQPHRAEVSKMLVRRSARRRGIAQALMEAVVPLARAYGKSLLVLDTASDSARGVYERCGWTHVGDVPDFALLPAGGLCATSFYYLKLA
jgi:GNAT superfamily N-acetyltransferase